MLTNSSEKKLTLEQLLPTHCKFKNIGSKYLDIYQEKKNTKNSKKETMFNFENIVLNYNLARVQNDLHLQDYYLGKLLGFCDDFSSSYIKKYNWDEIYPGYKDEFFAMMRYQMVRRISSDYGVSIRKSTEIGYNNKNGLNKENEKKKSKFNFISMLISLQKHCHETIMMFLVEKQKGRDELRKMMKSSSSEMAMIGGIYKELNNDFSLYENGLGKTEEYFMDIDDINSRYFCGLLSQKLKNLYPTMSCSCKKRAFSSISFEEVLEELELSKVSERTMSALKNVIMWYPSLKNELKHYIEE